MAPTLAVLGLFIDCENKSLSSFEDEITVDVNETWKTSWLEIASKTFSQNESLEQFDKS